MIRAKNIDLEIRKLTENYNKAFPNRPPLVYSHGWLYGIWMIGNYYARETDFHGAYPHGLLKRYEAIFGTPEKCLHLFSGSLSPSADYTRFDLVQEADVKGDAHLLSRFFPHDSFDIIYADPPYTGEDAEHYGTLMVNRSRVVKECYKILKPGGYLVWLDQVYPMWSKKQFQLIGTIGIVRSTNHRFRVICIWKKLETNNGKNN